ncbi:MAG: hypothetical protein IOD12_16320 [Silvanigrellales bacterium]|nr:hypothetical protein [Silvanigrellales bacterium]
MPTAENTHRAHTAQPIGMFKRACTPLLALLLLALPSPVAFAQEYWNDEGIERPHARIEIPLIDAPYNFQERRDGYSWVGSPSMGQTLGLSNGFYQTVHAGLGMLADPNDEAFWPRFFARFGFFLFDYLTFDFPGLGAWTHEEWHRAVMTHRGVRSYNEVNDFLKSSPSSGIIAVSGERDADLARMKRDHNADFVRLQAAGFEAQWEQNRRFSHDAFFHGTKSFDLGVMWINHVNTYTYLHSCSNGTTDEIVDDLNDAGETEKERDFAGPDCTGWVSDLFRANEPYEARGKHPTGEGVNRYRKSTDLTPSERSYLNRNKRFALINFIDPFAYGFEDFWYDTADGVNYYYNFRGFHYLTGFGGDTGVQLYLKSRGFKGTVSLHFYKNRSTTFPGVEFQWVEAKPFEAFSSLAFTPRLMAWTQPEGLRFFDKTQKPGGLVSLRVAWKEKRYAQPWLELQAKSEGWVAGEVNQSDGLATRLGVASEF